jgi:hypothetical protein
VARIQHDLSLRIRRPISPRTEGNHWQPKPFDSAQQERAMNGIIYLVGLVVVVMAVLSLIGLH